MNLEESVVVPAAENEAVDTEQTEQPIHAAEAVIETTEELQPLPEEPVIQAQEVATEPIETAEISTPETETVIVSVVEAEQPQVISGEPSVSEPVSDTQSVEAVAEVTESVQELPTETASEETTVIPAETPAASTTEADKEAEINQKNLRKEKNEQIYQRLVRAKELNETIHVEIKSRIRGGLRVLFEDMQLFLPASHFTLKRTPTEHEMQSSVGTTIPVKVHELQEYDEGRKAVIVSRKEILIDEFWNTIKTGDIVEGKVTSIASFGVFLELGGVEGLIHISRLSQVHVDDPHRFVKKGEILRAVVVELDRTKNRIALSRKELEESPWKDIEEKFPIHSRHKGIVRRLTDFGAYIELKPGIDGLLRTPEISWTKRIRKPGDVLKPGQEIEIEIIAVSAEKQSISLSLKNTTPNPWISLVDRFPVGTEYEGTIAQVLPQGCIISLSEDVDGFMPRSKMRDILAGNKIPFHPGDSIKIRIADLIPDEESLILAPVAETASPVIPEAEQAKKHATQNNDKNKNNTNVSITLVDMLSETDRKTLFKSMNT